MRKTTNIDGEIPGNTCEECESDLSPYDAVGPPVRFCPVCGAEQEYIKEDEEDYYSLFQITVGGKPFRCDCGGNVFRSATKPSDEKHRYTCTACEAKYEGE